MVLPAVALVCKRPAVAGSVCLGRLGFVKIVEINNGFISRLVSSTVEVDSLFKVYCLAAFLGNFYLEVIQPVGACHISLDSEVEFSSLCRDGDGGICQIPSSALESIGELVADFHPLESVLAYIYVEFLRVEVAVSLVQVLL